MSEFPKLPRKPLGYDPAAVDRLISERDSMLGLAEHRIRQAETKLADLEEQLRARDQLMAQLQTELEARDFLAANAEPEQPQPDAEDDPPPLTPKFMTEELSKIVVAAEESTSQIIERAWAATRDQIVEADRLWRDVQGEAVRFASWREDAEAIVESVKGSIQAARAKIEEVPLRVQEALAPAVEAMVEVDAGMARFAVASTLPLLVAPTGLQAVRSETPSSTAPPDQVASEEAGTPSGLWVEESYLEADGAAGEDIGDGRTGREDDEEAFASTEGVPDDDSVDPSAANIWRGSA